jgi:hypothetical protein
MTVYVSVPSVEADPCCWHTSTRDDGRKSCLRGTVGVDDSATKTTPASSICIGRLMILLLLPFLCRGQVGTCTEVYLTVKELFGFTQQQQ